MEQTCWIHVDWFFEGNYSFDNWLERSSTSYGTWYYIKVTRYQYDTIRSLKPKATNNRDQNEALIESLKSLLDKYELVEREQPCGQ